VGERRHITVMFCDLVDSTGIAAKLDAEEWRDLVGAYLNAASSAVITDMGGKVAKKLGDGLMALFGYPIAQENDAERAVRAALSVQRALADLNCNNQGTGKRSRRALSAKTVGELRKATAWPETLAVTTPHERHADSAVKVSKVSIATRTAPKS
jgi:class 3 adenylate cyclase